VQDKRNNTVAIFPTVGILKFVSYSLRRLKSCKFFTGTVGQL